MDTAAVITTGVLSLAFIANIALGGSVLLQNPKQWLNRFFFVFSFSAALWVLTNLLYAIISNTQVQFVLALLSYAAAGLLALFFLLYCIELVRLRRRQVTVTIGIIGLIVTVCSTIPGYVASSVTTNGKIVTNTVPLMIYGIYLLLYMGGGIGVLLRGRYKARGIEKDRITIVLIGLVAAAVLGLILNLALPFMGNYDYVAVGPVASLILAGSSTYAIIRHRLFDVKLAAVRTVAYGGAIMTLAAAYYMLAYLLFTIVLGQSTNMSTAVMPYNVALALLLAFLFQPIKRFFDKVTNDIFYKNAYSSETFFAELGSILTSTTDLRGLLESASQQIALTFKAEQAFFRLSYRNSIEHHISAGTRHHTTLPVYDMHMLDAYVGATDGSVFITDLIDESNNNIRRMLRSHKIALVVPLARADEGIGYLLLGDHRSGSYTKRDIKTLTAMRNELVIAIQNALSLHEVRELNATLQQRIDVATKELRSSNAQLKHLDEVKDEFMSMASHQLRTPLTSIKGYLSMVIDGDAGKITPQQEKLLQEAFHSSERMVHLIADFLNVSRLQTGKFVVEKSEIDLNELVQTEVRDLQVMAAGRNMTLRLDAPTGPLYTNADAGKLREVIMNFVDNAIYYSKAESTITVKVVGDDDSISFTVVDQGIGVPKDEQARLFGKFFRATNARKQRPDGTGVGLYLARKVIAAHHGSIIFASHEGKGSTFGFRLPRSKAAPAKS